MGKRLLLVQFGKKVREERLKRKLTQEGLAKIAGVHRTYIGMIERGEKNLTLTNLLKISKALNVKTSKLVEDL
jgi:transcriptional regulator with XRE-family HTH domain